MTDRGARKTPAKKSAAKKSAAKKSAAKKSAAKKVAPASSSAARKVPAKKTPVKRAPSRRVPESKAAPAAVPTPAAVATMPPSDSTHAVPVEVLSAPETSPVSTGVRAWMPSLAGIRWWAAIAVIIHHTLNAFVGTGFIKLDSVSTFASGGYLAVTLFFILSGFVLTWGWKESWTSSSGRVAFYKNRFARIYPLYLLCIPVYWWYVNHVLHTPKAHVTPQATVAEVALVHSAIPLRSYYGAQSLVTWSLSCEAIFYALLPLILIKLWKASDRTVKWVAALSVVWLAVLPVLTVMGIHSEQVRRGIELNPIFCGAHFMLGVCAGIAFRRGWRPSWNPNLVLVGMLASFFVACVVLRVIVFGDWSHLFGAQPVPHAPGAREHLGWLVGTRLQFARFVAHFIFMPFALMTVIALASADLRGKKSFVSGRATVLLGNWSYSMYLSHAIVIGYVWGWWRRWGITGPGYQLLLVFGFCIVVAGLLHYIVEKPASTLLRTFFARRDRARPMDLSVNIHGDVHVHVESVLEKENAK